MGGFRGSLLAAAGALVIALLAGALVTTYSVLNNHIRDVERQLRETQAQVDSTSTDVKRTNQAEVTKLSTRLDDTNALLETFMTGAKSQAVQIKLLNECLPELENQLGSIAIGTSDYNGYLTEAYISNPAPVSKHCWSLIHGTSPGD